MSTYSPSLRIELITTGDQAGTWGNTTNTNLGTLIEDAITGYTSVSITSANQALTAINGAPDQSRNATIALTTTTGANFSVYAPPAEKQYVIYNASAYQATIYNSTVLGNTTAAGTGVIVPAGKTMAIWSDGTNFRVQTDYFSSISTGALTTTGTVTASGPVNVSGAADFSNSVTLSGGTSNSVVYLNGSKVATTGTALQFDGTNLGLGVTPSAWGSSYKAAQVGSTTALWNNGGTTWLSTNLYRDSLNNNIYITTNPVSAYLQNVDGTHNWYYGPSGTAGTTASMALVMSILASGNLQQQRAMYEIKVSISGTNVIDVSSANYFSKTISTTTTFTVSNVPFASAAASFILDLTNGGAATINWWTGVKWAGGTAPTLTTSGRDVLGFFTYDGGTTWTGLVLGKDVK